MSSHPLPKCPGKLEADLTPATEDPKLTAQDHTARFPSSLRPDALSFLPHQPERAALEGNGIGATEGGSGILRQAMHKTNAFDEQSSWEAYSTQFELLADLNHWTMDQKAAYLAVSLRGTALTVLTNFPPEQKQDYNTLSQVLQNWFGTGHQTELNRAKLRGRLRWRVEMLPALAEDVERLTCLAYPEATEAMIS